MKRRLVGIGLAVMLVAGAVAFATNTINSKVAADDKPAATSIAIDNFSSAPKGDHGGQSRGEVSREFHEMPVSNQPIGYPNGANESLIRACE